MRKKEEESFDWKASREERKAFERRLEHLYEEHGARWYETPQEVLYTAIVWIMQYYPSSSYSFPWVTPEIIRDREQHSLSLHWRQEEKALSIYFQAGTPALYRRFTYAHMHRAIHGNAEEHDTVQLLWYWFFTEGEVKI